MQKSFLLLLLTACTVIFAEAQNVGIGTNAPAEKLHVNGNIKADTVKPNALTIVANAGAGKILTSDAAGNGTWQLATSSAAASPAGGAGFGAWGDCNVNAISEYFPVADTAASPTDDYGFSVAISGSFAIVGNVGKSCAYIYQFNGTAWTLMQKLTDPTMAAQSGFGFSVAISGNLAIVGAVNATIGSNVNQGAATIFQFNGSSWVLVQKLTDPTGSAQDFFGSAVAISPNFIMVGAILDDVGANTDQGSACVFHFNGTTWAFTQRLIDATGAPSDFFSNSISISGNFAALSSPLDDNAVADQGSVTIFQLNGANWSPIKKIFDSTNVANSQFGVSVSLSGSYLAVSEPQDAGLGSASVYFFNGTDWQFVQKFKDPSPTAPGQFGTSVSLSGDYLLVGDQSRNNVTGSATLFVRVGLGWQKLQLITDPAGSNNNSFGRQVSIDGSNKRFLIGVPAYANGSGKAIFGRVN